jgi:hypothetical protein
METFSAGLKKAYRSEVPPLVVPPSGGRPRYPIRPMPKSGMPSDANGPSDLVSLDRKFDRLEGDGVRFGRSSATVV